MMMMPSLNIGYLKLCSHYKSENFSTFAVIQLFCNTIGRHRPEVIHIC